MSRYAIPPLIHRHLPRNPSQALDLLPSVPVPMNAEDSPCSSPFPGWMAPIQTRR